MFSTGKVYFFTTFGWSKNQPFPTMIITQKRDLHNAHPLVVIAGFPRHSKLKKLLIKMNH